jgi:carbonic anhydrase/acetyltransferase-like protein (isoleucine patch superfamily)
MPLIKSVRGFTPEIGENTYMAENATIIGDVIIGRDCSIWFNTVLRGDVNSIRIGDRVNVQDGTVIHTLYQKSVSIIGNDVSIGHNAVIHGAEVKDGALIGMGAIVLDHAVVGEGGHHRCRLCVLSGTQSGTRSIYAVYRQVRQEGRSGAIQEMNQKIAGNYLMYASWFTSDPRT